MPLVKPLEEISQLDRFVILDWLDQVEWDWGSSNVGKIVFEPL